MKPKKNTFDKAIQKIVKVSKTDVDAEMKKAKEQRKSKNK